MIKSKNILLGVILTFGINGFAGIFEDVATINKGIDGYVVGKTLTNGQQKTLENNGLKSDNPNVRKFLANDNLLIAINAKNLKVLAINKRYNQIEQKQVKSMIGNLIHDNDEPTAMAHDKMIYWIFDAKGEKLTEDDLKKWKNSLKDDSKPNSLADAVKKDFNKKEKVDFNPYLSVKLSSDQPMMTKQEESKLANVYLMISSDKLITQTTTNK